MEEIKLDIKGVRMTNQDNGGHHLILVVLNAMQADILKHTLGDHIVLGHIYDGHDITFHLVFELPHINKLFKVPVNASAETKKWLEWIDENLVTNIWVAYPDGKGGIIPVGPPIPLY